MFQSSNERRSDSSNDLSNSDDMKNNTEVKILVHELKAFGNDPVDFKLWKIIKGMPERRFVGLTLKWRQNLIIT